MYLKSGIGAGPFMIDKERAKRDGIATIVHRQVVIDGPDVVDRAQLDSAGAAKAIDMFVAAIAIWYRWDVGRPTIGEECTPAT